MFKIQGKQTSIYGQVLNKYTYSVFIRFCQSWASLNNEIWFNTQGLVTSPFLIVQYKD